MLRLHAHTVAWFFLLSATCLGHDSDQSTPNDPCFNAEFKCWITTDPLCRTYHAYDGHQTRTKSGRTCQKWTRQWPHVHNNAHEGDHNFCRNPDFEEGPWCYTTDFWVRWEYCFPACELPTVKDRCYDVVKDCWIHSHDCRYTTDRQLANVTKSTTVTGRQCQNWNSQSPHLHTNMAVGNHNYCRNPDGEPAPWCYTTDPYERFELCYHLCN